MLFLQAISHLNEEDKAKSAFLLIGQIVEEKYGQKICRMADMIPEIHVLGLLDRKEMLRAYANIDVVVCPSKQDSLPIVLTEGMMHEKICIVSKNSGTASFITEGLNGFLISPDNVDELKDVMEKIIRHPEIIELIGKQARKVFEEYFRLDIFGERLECELLGLSVK